jgi:hypothetical protein
MMLKQAADQFRIRLSEEGADVLMEEPEDGSNGVTVKFNRLKNTHLQGKCDVIR